MNFTVIRCPKYDYVGQTYDNVCPQLHTYPATMLPQIGIDILKEFKISGQTMLDPYCGSGTSFVCGIENGFAYFDGYDINPLAVLITRAKYTKISIHDFMVTFDDFRRTVKLGNYKPPNIVNINFWFSESVIQHLCAIKFYIDKIQSIEQRQLFLLAFSKTVADASYRRTDNNKLNRMHNYEDYKPDVFDMFYKHLNDIFNTFVKSYLPRINNVTVNVQCKKFFKPPIQYDVVLTSPPYGDSSTTISYGQFSVFTNEWLGISHARKIDQMLMGGRTIKNRILHTNTIAQQISNIPNEKRRQKAIDFFVDLQDSIKDVAEAIKSKGYAIYIVGNRHMSDVHLYTDQFVAEQFCNNGFKHVVTYERQFPSKALPTTIHQKDRTIETMTSEYIVICQKSTN
jgi:DNA modification methylase